MTVILDFFKDYFSSTSIFIILVDAIFLAGIVAFLYSIFRYNNRAIRKFYLVIIVVVVYLLILLINPPITGIILKDVLSYWPLLLILLFFTEIRLVVESFEIKMSKRDVEASDSQMMKTIISTVEALSKEKTGALITFERRQNLDDYISKAIIVNAEISQEIILSIFNTQSPTHDGAVIIKNGRIACAGAYYPASDSDKITKTLGSRHRAALGISELYDCLTIIVSEETGRVSLAIEGYIERNVTKETLQLFLSRYLDI